MMESTMRLRFLASFYLGMISSILMPSDLLAVVSAVLIASGAYWYLDLENIHEKVLEIQLIYLEVLPILLFIPNTLIGGAPSIAVMSVLGSFITAIYLHTSAASSYIEESGKITLETKDGDTYTMTCLGIVDNLMTLYPWQYFDNYQMKENKVVLESGGIYRLIHSSVELRYERDQRDSVRELLESYIGSG